MQRIALLLALLVTPLNAATVTRVVPIVLDVTTDTARYTTELTLTNDTPDAVTMSALYTPALGSKIGNGTVTDSLAPGEQRRIPDVLSWLRMKGLPLPPVEVESSQGGTLKLDFTGPSVEPARVWALARTGSDTRPPQPVGRSGVAYAAPVASEGASHQGVAGLRSNATDRSNLAIVNLSDQPVSFEVNIQSLVGSYVVFPVRGSTLNLPPWGWMQIDSAELLDANGIRDGYAYVSGPDGSRLYLYGVINDRVTNDGSFLAPIDGCGATAAFPAVETFGFTTELTLIQQGYQGTTFQLNYVESASPGMGAGGGANESSDAFSQTIYPNVFNLLRDSYVRVGPFGAAGYSGVLSVNPLFGGLAMERVLSPSPAGGAFGVALPGACLTNAATDRAAIYGLVANDTNRSNVAVFSLEGSVNLRVDVHDGLAGGVVRGAPMTISLGPLEWRQVNGILRSAGVAEGWVEITSESAAGLWFAYGVVNDGAYPGERTGDGAYVPGIPQNLSTSCTAITVLPLTIPEGTVTLAYVGVTFSSVGGLGGWTLTGALPAGMTFNPLGVKGNFNIWLPTLSGTPAQAGTFPFIVTVTDANGCTGSRSYALVIAGLPGVFVDRAEVVPLIRL